jgi:N utilization substance protein A
LGPRSAKKLAASTNAISFDRLIVEIETAVTQGYLESLEANQQARAKLNRETGQISLFTNESEEPLEEPADFNRFVTGIVRRTVKLKIREMNDLKIVGEFTAVVGDVVHGVIQQGRDARVVFVNLGSAEGRIPQQEQVPTEKYEHGDRIKAFVVEVKQGPKGPDILLSRTHPGLVKKLFSLEVPEVLSGVVEIMGVAREAGARTKISVRTHRAGVNPKGSLIGPMGTRVQSVMNELQGEKIDIVDWSEDPSLYVAAALAPSRVISSEVVDEERRQIKVVVPDFQLSLAIGKDGQNARLAARLTGWRIDIHADHVEVG